MWTILIGILWPTFKVGVLYLLSIQKVDGISINHDSKSFVDQGVSKEVLQRQHYPLKFPGYLFVPLVPHKSYDSNKTPLNAKMQSRKEENGFEGLDENVVNEFIDEFLQARFLDLMKEEIASHYKMNKFEAFEVDKLTNFDLRHGLSNYDDDRRYRICESCAPGYPGPRGNQGRTGVQGTFGDKGNLGPRGDQGDQGVKGKRGDRHKGQKGAKGFKGRKGELGDPGSKGLKGLSLKGFKGDRKFGPKGERIRGMPGGQGSSTLCCNPGLLDPATGICYFHVEEEMSYFDAETRCNNIRFGAIVVDFTIVGLDETINTITNFLDEAGTNIWSWSHMFLPSPPPPSSSQCKVWDFATGAIILKPCLFPNDFVCQYHTAVTGCF